MGFPLYELSKLEEQLHFLIALLREERQRLVSKTPYYDKLVKYMHEDWHREFKVDDVCRALGVSASTLLRRLNEEKQQNYEQLQRYIRVQRAIELLGTSDDRIADIGYAVGFQSPSYFNVVFRRVTDTTPGAMRKKLRGG